jgi:hypothetical protein
MQSSKTTKPDSPQASQGSLAKKPIWMKEIDEVSSGEYSRKKFQALEKINAEFAKLIAIASQMNSS